MIYQGKHAKITLLAREERLLKVYENLEYAEQEEFALNFIAKYLLFDFEVKRESENSISLKIIADSKMLKTSDSNFKSIILDVLEPFIKNIHTISFEKLGYYLNHGDLFLENIIVKDNNELYLIDWGLSHLCDSVYLDMASLALGLLNQDYSCYKMFLEKYFGSIRSVNINEIKENIIELANKYSCVRNNNCIETKSLSNRKEQALQMVKLLEKEL